MKKILWLFIVWFWIMNFIYAKTTINLYTDKKNYNINESINLNVEIKTDWNWTLTIQSLSWLDFFTIVGQSKANSFTSINWNSQLQMKLMYSLKAKKEWDFILWPLVIKNDNEIIKSDFVKISIRWKKILLWNSSIIKWNNWNNILDDWDSADVWKKLHLQENNWKNVIMFFLVIVFIWLVYFLFTKLSSKKIIEIKKLFIKYKNIVLDKIKFFYKSNESFFTKFKNVKFISKSVDKEKTIDKEEKISLPDINSESFLQDSEKIIKIIIEQKFNIFLWKNLTYNEIIKELEHKNINKKYISIIKKLFEIFYKWKYSNLIVDKKMVLDLLWNFLEDN